MKAKGSSKRFRKCIIHIGTEKTGTSAIQAHLSRHRRTLLAHDILYPKTAGTNNLSQWEFVAAVQIAPWGTDLGRSLDIVDEASQQRFTQEFTARLEQEFAQHQSAQTLLISSEHFHSRLKQPRAIDALKRFLSPWCERFEIIVYFRRQDQVAISFQSTRLKSSVELKNSSLESAVRSHPRYFDLRQVYKGWANAFGANNMNPRIYDKKRWNSGNVLEDFASAASLPDLPTDAAFVNLSLNRQGYQFLRALNRVSPQPNGDKTDPMRLTLVQEISRRYAGKYYPVSQMEARKLMEQFHAQNEELRQLAFPQEPAPLFGDDFNEYPEIAEPLQENYDEAVEIALALWRHKQSEQHRANPIVNAIRKLLKKLGLGQQ